MHLVIYRDFAIEKLGKKELETVAGDFIEGLISATPSFNAFRNWKQKNEKKTNVIGSTKSY